MNPLPGILDQHTLPALALLCTRVSALVLVAPMFSAAVIPVRIKAVVVLVLTAVLLAPAQAHATPDLVMTAPAFASEALLGIGIGLSAAVFAGAAEMAGDLMTVQMGLSGAAVLDPLTNISVPVLAQFSQMFVATVLLACNAHLIVLDALATTLAQFPLGGDTSSVRGLPSLLALGSALFILGVKLAAPVMASALLGNVALAILGRAAPQLNILSVAFPLQIGLGLFAFATAIPVLATRFADWSRSYDTMLTPILRSLAPGGG